MNSEESRPDPEIEARRWRNIVLGMRRAVKKGRHIGRPRGKEAVEKFLSKASVRPIQGALAAGLSLREAARVACVSVNTVRKVKAALEGTLEQSHEYDKGDAYSYTEELASDSDVDWPYGHNLNETPEFFTRSDLPDDLNEAYYFCAKLFCLQWGHEWNWGRRGEIAYFATLDLYFLFRMGQPKIYLGHTPHEVEENLLAYVNTGHDSAMHRIHPTPPEIAILVRLARSLGDITKEMFSRDEHMRLSSLIDKGLFSAANSSESLYRITDDGQLLLQEVSQRDISKR